MKSMMAWWLGLTVALVAGPAAALSMQEPERPEPTGGAGGPSGGSTNSNLAYTVVTPCRIADTRQAGGSLAVGVPRDFRVSGLGLQGQGGSAAGCQVPQGTAKAAVLNFVAVNPTGNGDFRAWAYSTPTVGPPTASILNYAFGLNIANGIVIPLCNGSPVQCPFDVRVQADGSGSHLVVDVVGYFSQSTLLLETAIDTAPIQLASTCTNVQQITVAAPAAGRVVVQALAQFYSRHASGAADDIYANLSTSPTECSVPGDGRGYRSWIHPNAPATETVETGGFWHVFQVPAAGNYTFYLNAFAIGGGAAEQILSHRMLATFHAN